VADLGTEQLTNVLVFDVTRSDHWFAFTFDLAHSVDGLVEIDRGYLLVTDDGPRRRVKARKIIRLADGRQSEFGRVLIDEACPLWGLWIKRIVAAAAAEAGPGVAGPGVAVDSAEAIQLLSAVYRHRFLDFANRSTRVYGDYAVDVGSQLMSGSYNATSALRDGLRLTWHLTQDLARLGAYAREVFEAIEAETGSDRTRRGLTGLHPVEHVTWPLPGPGGRLAAQDLTSISPGNPILPKSRIVVTPATYRGGPAAKVAIDTTGVPYGMYVGSLLVDGQPVPFQFYVSQAVTAPA
jgi:hypothetical protein